MNSLQKYFPRTHRLLTKVDNKLLIPIIRYVQNKGRRVYYTYNPRTKLFDRIANKDYQKLKSYSNWIGTDYKNSMSLAETRKRLNLIPMSNTPCRIGRRQKEGTCWFQSIINGWLLSDYARIFLQKRVDAYKKVVPLVNKKSCPKKTYNPDLFFSYVDAFLKNTNHTSYKNKNIIANLSMAQNQPERGLYGAHVAPNTEIFLNNIFNNMWSRRPITDIYVTDRIKSVPGYRLSHASIGMRPDKGIPHAVTGYMCNGKPVVYDSNAGTYLNVDWTSKMGLKKLSDYYTFYKYYHPNSTSVKTTYYVVIYLRIRPKFLNTPYYAPKLQYTLLSNKRLAEQTGFSNRNKALNTLTRRKLKLSEHSNLSVLKNVYRRKFKEDPPKITNSKTLYHKIKGIPYNGKLKFEHNLVNNYSNKNINQFIVNKFGRTSNNLSKNTKKNILKSFYYNTPYYDEVNLNIWKKVYKLKFGKNAPNNLNTNKKIYNAM